MGHYPNEFLFGKMIHIGQVLVGRHRLVQNELIDLFRLRIVLAGPESNPHRPTETDSEFDSDFDSDIV